MSRRIIREAALLTAPVLAIAAVAMWKSRPEPARKQNSTPMAKPRLSTPPQITAFHWTILKSRSRNGGEQIDFAAKGYHQTVGRTGLPPGIHFSGVRWKWPFRVTQVRLKSHGRWRTPPNLGSIPAIATGSLLYGSSSAHGQNLPRNFSEASITLSLNGVPAGTQAIRFKLALQGDAGYSGIWSPGVPLPPGMRIKGQGWYEETVVSPPSEIEIKSIEINRADLLPRGT